jgi:glycosyltransferase involved in cell wall biosynthesis
MPAERVLIVARELTRGGAAYLALRHARRLSAAYSVDVLVTGPCDDAFLAEFPPGVSIYRLGEVASRPEGSPLRFLHRFAVERGESPPFRREYRAMLATSIFPDWQACAAAASVCAGRRLVFLVDEGLVRYPGLGPPERGVVERCIRGADMLLPVSRRLLERMAVHCPPMRGRPWKVLRPPIDVDRIVEQAGAPGSAIVPGARPAVLTVARLTPDKQVAVCLRVHHRLRAAGLRFRWYVVGTGPEEPALRDDIRRLGMEDDFLILPCQENLYACMRDCDVFALFSSSEGCPTVVLEALMLGCPVVMTDVNGSDELIDHGRTGLVVANDEEAIAGGLARMLGDDRLRRACRDAIAAGPLRPDALRDDRTLLDLVAADDPPQPEPRVTILIPTYNQERFIDRAVASALGQDFPSLEVVVADDASTDATGPSARSWSFDRRLRYARNGRNLGRVANYRRGLTELARGRWVLVLDGDDFLDDPGFIRRACEAVDRHAGRPIVFAQAGHRVHYQQGGRRDVDILPPIDCDECAMSGGDYLRFVFATGFFTHLGALYDRERALSIGFYTAEISSSDMDSLLRLALEGDVLVLNTIAGCWVQHGGNASSALGLGEIVPNVRIFRRIAGLAVARGRSSWRQLDGPLTQYEAQTLIHLFGTTIGRTSRGPTALLRMLAIGLRINPALLRDRLFLSGCLGFVRPLFGLAARRAWGRKP